MSALTVVFLPQPGSDDIWRDRVRTHVHPRHVFRVLDAQADLAGQLADADVVIDAGGSVGTREMLDVADSVRLWQILGTGIDHFDLDYWTARGVPVANCPGPMSAVALAEHALMLMMMVLRRIPQAQHNLTVGELYRPVGAELEGRRLGLVGFGSSARELSVRASAMGMRVRAVDLRPVDLAEARRWGAERVDGVESLDRMLAEVDVVSLHLHLTPATTHTLSAERLRLLPASGVVINVSRGALIDEEALADALWRGELAGAGLDVFAVEPPDPRSRLLTHPGVVSTPHVAGVTDGTADRRARGASENVERVAAGLVPLHLVNDVRVQPAR